MEQGAKIAGASVIIAVDPVALKRHAALGLGATHTVDPGDGEAVEQVKALTGGRGVDYAFEVIGNTDLITQAFNCTRPGGMTIALIPNAGATSAAMRSHSSCTAFPSSKPVPTPALRPPVAKSNASMCVALIVSAAARPGQMDLRPPVNPAK